MILLKYSRLLYEQVETLVYPIFFLWNNLICLWPYKESFMGKLVCSRQLDFRLTTVELPYPSTSHKQPPPIHVSDRLSKTPKLFHLLWATMTTFWAWKFNDFSLFLSSCKRPLDTFSDLYFSLCALCYLEYTTCTWKYTWCNLGIALSRSAQTSSWKRPPVILFLKATTSNKQPLILFILDGQLREAKL